MLSWCHTSRPALHEALPICAQLRAQDSGSRVTGHTRHTGAPNHSHGLNRPLWLAAGIRYPAKLLPEVVATLGAAKALVADKGQVLPGEGGPRAPSSALAPHSTSQAAKQAAAMSANLQKRTDPVSPVHGPSLQKAFRSGAVLRH